MTRLVRRILVIFVAAAVPAVAHAQAPLPVQVPPEPTVTFWYIGANTGVAVVEKFGPIVSFEGGIRVWKNLDAVGEITWTGNVSTNRQHEIVDTLATELQRVQGGEATGDIKVPSWYGGLGLRWVFEQDAMFRPYVIVTVGASRIDLQPTLTLNGADVTDQSGQYGITLGQDVIGTYVEPTISGGAGIILIRREWYVDLGVRMASIYETDETVNVPRLLLGGGYRF